MKAPREPLRTKRTASGKIMGRPVKRSGAEFPPVQPVPPRLKLYFKKLRDPGYVMCPTTGEPLARRFGPGAPIFEWREPKIGRPRMRNETVILHIVQAVKYRGQRGGAQQIVERGAGNSPAAVKQRFTRTRRQMRRRADDLSSD